MLMTFVKLDCTILRSTIWMDRPAREVFITALLMAEPREFTESVEQLRVGAIEPTGWSAPPGWYGFVPAAGPGIVGAALLPQDEGMAALERLGSPDPESRSQAHGGRRMIRIDGGYLVLNYMKHRDKDHTSPLRSARYRERLKQRHAESQGVTPESRNHTVTSHTRDMPMPSASDVLSSEPGGPPKTLRLAKACPSSSSDAQSLGSTLSARNPTPEQPSSAAAEGIQPSVIPTVLREIPDGMALPEDVRQDARIIGLSDQQIDHYWGGLCKGPIGGTRGILQKHFAQYLRDLPKQWKVWADTEKARSSHQNKRSGAFGGGYGSGSVTERPGAGWGPEQRGRMYAERFKLEVDAMARAYRKSLKDGQVLTTTELDEGFLKFMAAEVKKRKAAGI